MFDNPVARTSRAAGARADRGTVAALYAGMLLTAVATIAPFVDRATTHVLADHIRHGYPGYSDGRVDSAVTTWLVILTVIGVLGLATWTDTIWAHRAGKGWSRVVAVAGLLAGTAVALCALLTRDTSGEVGLAPQLGLIGLLPCAAGLLAVILMWRRS